jgi:hypothetical protein
MYAFPPPHLPHYHIHPPHPHYAMQPMQPMMGVPGMVPMGAVPGMVPIHGHGVGMGMPMHQNMQLPQGYELPRLSYTPDRGWGAWDLASRHYSGTRLDRSWLDSLVSG